MTVRYEAKCRSAREGTKGDQDARVTKHRISRVMNSVKQEDAAGVLQEGRVRGLPYLRIKVIVSNDRAT